MEWYYEQAGKPVGPISEREMETALEGGTVGPNTRVWREGWPDWRPAGKLASEPTGIQSAEYVSAGNMVRCSECNTYVGEFVQVSGVTVCLACKSQVLEKIREGVHVGGGPWRDGKVVVNLKGAPMPDACFKCGAPASMRVKKKLSWHPPFYYVLIVVALLLYVLVALFVRKSATVFIPLCAGCAKRHNRRTAMVWSMLVAAIGLFVLAGTVLDGEPAVTVVIIGVGLVVFDLIWVMATQLVVPDKIDRTHVRLGKAGAGFLEKLPQWTGL